MKKLTICLALLLAAALLCGSALAAASVTYEGGAEKFVFLPGSEYSDTDLFESFKGVLPGDELTQTITVKNDTDGQVRIYLRAEPGYEDFRDFLSNLSMTVDCQDKEIFDAAPSETAQLTKNTLLGTFKTGGSTTLTVTLKVPEDMGNEYMGAFGIVPWTFVAEEIPAEDTPQTGDWFQLGGWLAAAALIAAAIAAVLVLQRRRRQAN
ncbi:MAG: hypothetical protein ACI4MF_10105 [Candidatus Faecivicinus sp.]